MAGAYSSDLRERVLLAYEDGGRPVRLLAAQFRICSGTLYNWLTAARTQGRRQALPPGHGPAPRLGAGEQAVLRQLVAEDNSATLAEYGARLSARTGVTVCPSVLCVTLKRLGLVRKTYGPPRRQAVMRGDLTGLRQRIRSRGATSAKMEFRALWAS
jgi:transposase